MKVMLADLLLSVCSRQSSNLLFSLLFLFSFSPDINCQQFTQQQADSLYNESRKWVRQDPERAIELGEALLVSSQKMDYAKGMAMAKETIARAAMHKKSDSSALALALDAFNYAQDIEADSLILETINILGAWHYRNKQIHKVFEYNSLGRRYAKSSGNWEKLFLFTANAGSIMADLKDYSRALNFYKEAESLLIKKPDSIRFGQLALEMAKVYEEQDAYNEAMEYIQFAEGTLKHTPAKHLKTNLAILKGSIYWDLGQAENAKSAVNKASELLEGSRDNRSRVELNLLQAKMALDLKNYSGAEVYINKGLALAEELNYLRGKQELLLYAYRLKEEQDDFQGANTVLLAHNRLKDSIKFEESQNTLKIALAEQNYLREQEALEFTLDKARTSQRNIIVIAVLIILSLITILYILQRNTKALQFLNTQLKEKTTILDEANHTKNKLFSIIGHDLKGPIVGVKSLLDLLGDQHMTEEEFKALLPKGQAKVDHVLFSLNNLLSWGMSQLEGYELNPQQVKVWELAESVTILLSTTWKEKQLKLQNNIPREAEVWADAAQLEIVLRNLLSNAIKFTPEGGDIIFGAAQKGKNWEIWVRDSGLGMPLEVQHQIFDQNKKVTTRGTRNEKGTGLGLSLCIEMVRMNEGAIWVQSAENEGTQINFSLPASKS